MLAAIRGAQQSITFETYIYWSGQIAKDFAEALSERSRAGVRVHVGTVWQDLVVFRGTSVPTGTSGPG